MINVAVWAKVVMFLLGVVVILCLISVPIAILIGLTPVEGVLFTVGGVLFIIIFLVNPYYAADRFGWIGLGVWCGIYVTLGAIYYFLIRPKELEEKRKIAVRWAKEAAVSELGYDLMELKEQLGRKTITPEEYEQKKKLLQGLIELKEQLNRGIIHLMQYEQKKKKLLEKSEA